MKKIVLLPLDERPCNYRYPQMLFQENAAFSLTVPDVSIMPDKKQAADFEKIRDFLFAACADADCLVVSLEMLLYGGLLPSRLHRLSTETLGMRLKVLQELKARRPSLTIYAIGLIMRCPQYSSADEEPDYWEICGKEMFAFGVCKDKGETGAQYDALARQVAPYLDAFTTRRAVNLRMLERALDYVGDTIDFMVIPQDDSAPYGWTAIDQRKIRAAVSDKGKMLDCLIYPGADEAGLTLLARYVNSVVGTPRVAVDYSSCAAPKAIPAFEDRPLGESVKLQLAAAGCLRAGDEFSSDFTLMVNAPASGMVSAADTSDSRSYQTERSLAEYALKIRDLTRCGVRVAVADVAYANGADTQLVRMLDSANVAMQVSAYAGWNTSSNTLGTAIAQACLFRACGDSAAHKRFLALRYFEDAGYCAYTRKTVCERDLPGLGLNYFDAGERRGKVAHIVAQTIAAHMREIMPQVAADYRITQCEMPWKRMFEVGLTVGETL